MLTCKTNLLITKTCKLFKCVMQHPFLLQSCAANQMGSNLPATHKDTILLEYKADISTHYLLDFSATLKNHKPDINTDI